MKRPAALVDFLARLLFAGILGSAVIVAVAPFLRPEVLPPWLEGLSKSIRSSAALERAANGLADALLWGQRPSTIPRPMSGVPAPVNVPTATAAAKPAYTLRPAASIPRPTRAYWGIVNRSAAEVHNSAGDVPLKLPAATTLAVLGRSTTPEGAMIECRMVEGGGSQPFMLLADSINVYSGSLDAVPDATLQACRDYARLQADLSRILESAPEVDREDNPHLPAYRAAREAFTNNNREARNVQALFTDATGEERIQLGERLRLMKAEELRLQKSLAASRQSYDQWNAAHPAATPASTAAPTDPKVTAIEAELAALAPSLPPLATPP